MARVAALVGDPARSNILASMMDGRAHTPTELALDAGISAATASGHLARLLDGQLVTVVRQGRHRYYRLASNSVARILEGIMVLGEDTQSRPRAMPRVPADLRLARTCYDHLAGKLGVALTDAMVTRNFIKLDDESGTLTDTGNAAFLELGIDLAASRHLGQRACCRPCLDWSERRPHIAGVLGAALLNHFLNQRWIERIQGTRAIRVTNQGSVAFRRDFGITLESD
ncbi:winged helix-turn-helix domain-containing protein [Castellaniella sp. GW247-6E4]|uniref:ArsR/SmtB family transcription factor n=1 Tax=Castellaniella sp. GW247-6E4 TaxID=3140380 RepID=UPI003315E9BE